MTFPTYLLDWFEFTQQMNSKKFLELSFQWCGNKRGWDSHDQRPGVLLGWELLVQSMVWYGGFPGARCPTGIRTKPTQGSASFPTSVSSTFWSFHAWTSINLLTRNGLWQLYFRQLFLQPFQIACEELHFSISFFPYVFLPVDIKTKYLCCLIAYYISSEKQCWPFPTFLCIFPLDSCIPCPWMARCSPARGTSLLPMWPPWESSDSLPPDAAPTTRPTMAPLTNL